MPFVTVKEVGSRPTFTTPARVNAPQGAKVLADMLHASGVCDRAILMIDWDGDSLWDTQSKGPMPKEIKKPIFVVYADKYFSEVNRYAYIEIPIDIEDAFGQDNFSNTVAAELVDHIRKEFEYKYYQSDFVKEYKQ